MTSLNDLYLALGPQLSATACPSDSAQAARKRSNRDNVALLAIARDTAIQESEAAYYGLGSLTAPSSVEDLQGRTLRHVPENALDALTTNTMTTTDQGAPEILQPLDIQPAATSGSCITCNSDVGCAAEVLFVDIFTCVFEYESWQEKNCTLLPAG